MKNTFLLLSLFLATICQAQINYEQHSQFLLDAHRSSEKGELEQALKQYSKAFAINGANAPIEYVKAALCAAELGKPELCKAWLRDGVIKEKLERNTIHSFSDNEIYSGCAEKVLAEYDSLIEQHYSSIENPAVFFKLQRLINRDQYARNVGKYYLGVTDAVQEEAFEKLNDPEVKKDTALYKKYQSILFPKKDVVLEEFESKARRYADSLNVVELIEITKKHGWQKAGWLILWHQRGTYGQSNWVWDYFKPLIDQEIAEGKVAPYYWALFEDITSIYNTGKSVYGYHPGKVDAEKVNTKRKEIGLPLLTTEEIKERNNNPYGGRQF